MDFQNYQSKARTTAVYPTEYRIIYTTLGLCGEAGEISEKVKKVIRDKGGVFTEEDRAEISKELGDVLWYLSQLAADLDIRLEQVAEDNLEKLFSRQSRGKISGSGDNR